MFNGDQLGILETRTDQALKKEEENICYLRNTGSRGGAGQFNMANYQVF